MFFLICLYSRSYLTKRNTTNAAHHVTDREKRLCPEHVGAINLTALPPTVTKLRRWRLLP